MSLQTFNEFLAIFALLSLLGILVVSSIIILKDIRASQN
jgi:hypothetical protein